ncbi:secreted trypsin-like serine protease [Kibdelosporangium banguiense]|uniref:Secreted trypsin-like serine protease n=1 Tax=Kibdelosporangium banguiense TaxID=1365924 RepID=A0ABS4TXA9_9PSEU|nr:trypsin-like serine protease [Kibdelosporangium banguiense]MBP2328595.1 secreted trypsin-like serine protease [Kibdelosporangium banguiense]
MRKVLIAVFGACTLAFAVVGATASDAAEPTGGAQPSIIGGHNATETYSFMVALSNSCGGNLVAPQWIVTANHCGDASQGRIGSISKNSGGEVGQIDRRITKPGTDLTLMHLSAPARSAPVRMAQTNPAAGSPVRLIGWGCTSWPSCSAPVTLQEIDLTILPSLRCAAGGGTGKDVCVSGGRGQSACHGDSGGPALIGTRGNWTLVGETLGPGDNAGECATTTLYTGIAAHLSWIRQQTGT